jgi:hypothetical protein
MQQQTGGDDKGNFQKIGEGLGGLMGQAADTLAGVMGTMMSGMGGWWAKQQGGGGFQASFNTERDAQCRQHFSTQASGGGSVRSYDDARPLYQFGHMASQNPDYQGRSFDQVEMDLQRNWGTEQQQRYGGWPDVRGFVEFGYHGRSASESGRAGMSGTSGGFGGTPSGGYQASSGGASGGFKASGEIETDRTSGEFRASGGGSTDEGASGGFKASGEIERK